MKTLLEDDTNLSNEREAALQATIADAELRMPGLKKDLSDAKKAQQAAQGGV